MTAHTISPIAVTGATGVLGRLVANRLADAHRPLRLLVRTVTKAPELPDSTVVPFSYDDHDASIAALHNVQTLFMVSAPESERRLDQHRTFIDAAAAAGVEHIVYTSFLGAAPDATFTLARDHYVTEEHIKSSGMTWTFLRDSLYIDFMSALVGDDGVIRGPGGTGQVAIVTRADVAATAAAVLLDPAAHRNVTYDLTGPEALTMAQIAAILSTARGEHITFHDETLAEAYESRAKWGAPHWQNDAWVSTYTAIAAGELAHVSTDVETVTGCRPMALADYLRTTDKGALPASN
jgi:NAD(P)H dehydrogenase (quinone)